MEPSLCGTAPPRDIAAPGADSSELRRGRERVAGLFRSLLHAVVEPALTLLGGAMREAVGHHPALRTPLQRVVANRRGGAQRGLDITGLQQMPTLIGLVRPDAGEAIGLQLDADLDAICLRRTAAGRLLGCMRPIQNLPEILHVMANLVRDHI